MSLLQRDLENLAGVGGDAVGVAGAATHNPEDGVVSIDQKELAALVGEGDMVVGEPVANELCAMLHAEGLEAVALVPLAQSHGHTEGVGIEEGRGGGKGLEIGRKPLHRVG